jgi:pimeloyl-ACP methyl ester carboxylesterase
MREAALAYSSMRMLGEDLAAAGYPTLRFDYPAAGNSLDLDLNERGLHWSAWQHSIAGAIEWLRGVSGAKRVVLCGFASGGALATLVAAGRNDVAGLLLIEPVIVGRSRVRQLILEADLQRGQSTPREKGLEIRENRFSPFTVAQIGALDLRQVALPTGMKVAIAARTELKAANECLSIWTSHGVAATRLGFDGLEILLNHDLLDGIPLADFAAAIAWLKASVPPASPMPLPIDLPVAVLQPPGCIDTPLRFGPENRLFGMLCRPERDSPVDIVLIPSGGRESSSGAARQNVMLARLLAQAGIASFRFDFSGLGDSIGAPGKERVFCHGFTDRTGDVRAALDTLETLGFRRFAMHGLGLGAYHALQAAVLDPRIGMLMLINLPLFTAPANNAPGPHEQHSYLAKLLRPANWVNLLSGRSNRAALRRAALFHLHAHTIGAVERLARRLGLMTDQSSAHRAMATLSRRRVRTLYLFSDDPQDVVSFAAEFGADGSGLQAYPGAEMHIVPGMDRSLTITQGRVPAETMMLDFLLRARRDATDGEATIQPAIAD